MKRILVTGGAGFLGSHLCEKLINNGDFVYCLDNLYTGSMDNIKDLCSNPNFQFIEHDVELPLDIQVEQIYNFACPASPIHYQNNPVKTAKTNVIGIINILELVKKTNARVLQASTSEVYGNPQIHPQPENYWGYVNPVGVRSCYDEGKRMAETLCFDYHRMYDTEIKVIRIFNTYGPKMAKNDGRVVSNFILQALHNEDITIYGDGSQTRSFCYVDDLVEGAIRFMNSDKDFLGPVNMGNPEEYSMRELAELIRKLTKSSSEIVYRELPQDDPVQRKPVIEAAEKMLGWKPQISLKEGLTRTIEYFSGRK
ncbi:MAG: SDR family oxidoreductase [Ruminococcus flavefaciens]|nr:SDR family oxidoreductase [Roseburia sp.]MCM1231459.1 SDR family oxidoreductase [Ruminococcus flavefaciens]